MALYTSLPVYQAAYSLALDLFAFSSKFTREYRYTLGERLKKDGIDLILLIYQANCLNNTQKLDIIIQTREKAETLRLLLRLSLDLKICKLNTFVSLSEKLETISKQLTAWEKYYR